MSDLESFFGHQERRKGADLAQKNLVVISSASDTGVSAFVKGSSGARVTLSAAQVAAPTLSSNCTCPQARKGDLCKHIWAVLLKLGENGADFLEGKDEILPPGQRSSPVDDARRAKADAYKSRQRERLKTRNQEMREQKKRRPRALGSIYPVQAQEALDFFSSNGFPLNDLNLTALLSARKLLSRVFHPDKGGTNDEMLQLNRHFECLEEYLSRD